MKNIFKRILFCKEQEQKIEPIDPKLNNIEYNSKCWDMYAKTWTKENAAVENPDVKPEEKANYVNYLGDEWGIVQHVNDIFEEYIKPYINNSSKAIEIGVGGGRIASRVAPCVNKLYCLDVAPAMIENAKESLKNINNIEFILIDSPEVNIVNDNIDFIYSFDVFVHMDIEMIWKYFYSISNKLKSGGKVFLHTTNLKNENGWKNFLSQLDYRPGGYNIIRHYFIIPELIELFAKNAGFRIIKHSNGTTDNYYDKRDYMFVMEKI